MRAIVQRVKKASVEIDGQVYSEIDQGLLVLLAVSDQDGEEDLNYIKDKLVNMRIFTDENDKMNLSIKDIDGQILVVSQFTLYGDIRKGRRPSFTQSAKHEKANMLYEAMVESLKSEISIVKTGVFAADMQVSLVNDGPVTIQLDSTRLY